MKKKKKENRNKCQSLAYQTTRPVPADVSRWKDFIFAMKGKCEWVVFSRRRGLCRQGRAGRDDVVFNEVKDAEPGCASLLSVFHPFFAACAFIVCHQKERKRFWWASIFVLTPERGSGLAVSSLTWNPFSVKVICEGRLCVGMKKLSWPLHRLWAGAEHHVVFVLFTCTSSVAFSPTVCLWFYVFVFVFVC